MSLSGVDRGTGTHNTSATTFTAVPASNLTAGALAVMVISADNAGASGVAFTTFTVTDTNSNTWVRRVSPLYDPGAASAGVEGGIFTTRQNGGTLTTGSTITVTFNVATTAKTWTLSESVATVGVANFISGGVNTGSATASPTVTTAALTSGDMVFGACFNEHGTAQTPTGDADTTNGSWSTMQTAEIGTTAAGQTVISQRKVVTATATQTYNPTLGVSSDVILAWIQVRECGLVNLFTFTEQLDNAVYTKNVATITADVSTLAPNGTLTAEKLVEAVTNAEHYVQNFLTTVANNVYTVSAYVKAAERTQARIEITDGTNRYSIYVNLNDGSSGGPSSNGTVLFPSWSITDALNGWWRVSSTGAVSGTTFGLRVLTSLEGTGTGYEGDPTKGIYVWGAQMEDGELSAYKQVPLDLPPYQPLPLRAPILAQ